MTDAPILQDRLPHAPWMAEATRRLPGTLPLALSDWLVVDEAYGPQMALRDRLIATRAEEVHACLPVARPAAEETLDLILPLLPALGFRPVPGGLVRPDGVEVAVDRGAPLLTLGRLVQEDLCLLQRAGEEHVLTAAILCFPAGWRLDEKIGRPMLRIHAPVAKYTGDVGARVQRLMDLVRPGAPLWRANAHHSDAPLFNPQAEAAPKHRPPGREARFLRSERQALLRLPATGAVLFSIHTWIVRPSALTPEQAAALAAHPIHSA
jgi:hypothetical protein